MKHVDCTSICRAILKLLPIFCTLVHCCLASKFLVIRSSETCKHLVSTHGGWMYSWKGVPLWHCLYIDTRSDWFLSRVLLVDSVVAILCAGPISEGGKEGHDII